MINDDTLNAEDVANILHVGRKSVYAMAKSGELPYFKIGRKMFFTLSDIQHYLDNVRHENPSYGNEVLTDSLSVANRPDDVSFIIAGKGIAADMFIDRLELMGCKAARCLRTSYRGLIDLYGGFVDAALIHLYDQRSNSYNVPYVRSLAPGLPVVVFRLIQRWQGFAVAPGNPKGISSWGALIREDVRIANRSKGCGSRVLLDEKLNSMEADCEVLSGYESDYPTGLAAAEAVSQGFADVAVIGEQIAAHAKGIQFVPIQIEWLDMVVSKTGNGRKLAQKLRSLFTDEAFREEYARIVHGDISKFGSIIYEN